MDVVESQARPDTAEFRDNAARMTALVADLRARLEAARAGGGPAAHARHREQGKLPVRERLDGLLDPGSPFLEIAPLAAAGLYDGDAPGAGLVTGIGRVSGREVLIVANDATVKGGTYYPLTVKKHLRAQQVALARLQVRDIGAHYSVSNGNAEVKDIHAQLMGGALRGRLVTKDLAGSMASHLSASLQGVSIAELQKELQATLGSSLSNQIVVRGSMSATADATFDKTMQNLVARADATLQASAQPAQVGTITPINGAIHTRYSERSGQLSFDQSDLRIPQNSISLNGTISDHASLQVRFNSNDLHELETIATDPRSRYFDPTNPDCAPMPEDDPASHRYMHCLDGMKGDKHWHRCGDRRMLENPRWRELLGEYTEVDTEGAVKLDLESAVKLALIHDSGYRQQIENLYLSALDVSALVVGGESDVHRRPSLCRDGSAQFHGAGCSSRLRRAAGGRKLSRQHPSTHARS
jgi:hypothetical protein